MAKANVVSVSGGKDSTATLLLALERGAENLSAVFADTGNEHPQTYAYVDYLEGITGVRIDRVKANFDLRIAAKRKLLERRLVSFGDCYTNDRHAKGWTIPALERAIEIMVPTGNPFLDLCLWKGRFPSRKGQFCTQELKVEPINEQIVKPLLNSYSSIASWQGVRRDESEARANLEEWELEFGDTRSGQGLWNYRPILDWSADDVFAFHRKHGVKWNPLYEQGMGRVGCMPCINCNKSELNEIAQRFPKELERIAEWETLVSEANRRQCATFFAVRNTSHVSLREHGVSAKAEWAKTTRGGSQYDLIASTKDYQACSSVYGLCG